MTTATPKAPDVSDERRETWLARLALRFTAFTEKWLPDALGFVLVGTFLIFALGLVSGEKLRGVPADPKATSG